MKHWFRRFMYGRYGVDQFSLFLLGVYIFLTVLNLFLRFPYMIYLYGIVLLICYFRIFSKNISKRRAENDRFLSVYRPIRRWLKDKKERIRDFRTHRYFTCPNCNQRLRVPKGKGEITITCIKCRHRFDRRT